MEIGGDEKPVKYTPLRSGEVGSGVTVGIVGSLG